MACALQPRRFHSRLLDMTSRFSGRGGRVAGVARVTIICATLLLFTATAAWAGSSSNARATPGLLAVHPGPHGYFEYTISPGAATSGKVLVRDLTASPARYLVYITAARTSPVAGVAYGQPQANPHGISAWIKLATASVKTPARGHATVSFTVSVPHATAPGDYVAAVAAQPPAPTATRSASPTKRGVRLLTTTRVIIAVVIHVPGPRAPAANFTAPSVTLEQQRRQVLTIPINDTGNALMKPYLGGSLRRCTGTRPVLRLHRALDTFVPHTSIDYPLVSQPPGPEHRLLPHHPHPRPKRRRTATGHLHRHPARRRARNQDPPPPQPAHPRPPPRPPSVADRRARRRDTAAPPHHAPAPTSTPRTPPTAHTPRPTSPSTQKHSRLRSRSVVRESETGLARLAGWPWDRSFRSWVAIRLRCAIATERCFRRRPRSIFAADAYVYSSRLFSAVEPDIAVVVADEAGQ